MFGMRRLAGAVGVASVSLGAIGLGWLRDAGEVPARLLSGGLVFLGSTVDGAGAVGVVDALTGRELASVSIGGVGDGFSVVGGWRDGFGIDPDAGRVLRVDGRLLADTGAVSAGPGDQRLTVVAARDAVFVVRPRDGAVHVADAVTSNLVEVPVPGVSAAAVAGVDQAWILAGDRVGSIDLHGTVRLGRPVGVGSGSRLVVAGGMPVVVAASGGAMVGVDGRSLTPRVETAGPGPARFVVGTDTGWVLAVDDDTAEVFGIELADGRVARRFVLEGAARLGAPVSLEGLVYIPGTRDDGSAAVWVVDPASAAVVESPLSEAAGIVELGVQHGRVWWTDGTVRGRGSVEPNGDVTTVLSIAGGEAVLQCSYAGEAVAGRPIQFSAFRQDRQPIGDMRWEFQGDASGDIESHEQTPTVSWATGGIKRVAVTAGGLSTVCTIALDNRSDSPPSTTEPLPEGPPDTGTTPSTTKSETPPVTLPRTVPSAPTAPDREDPPTRQRRTTPTAPTTAATTAATTPETTPESTPVPTPATTPVPTPATTPVPTPATTPVPTLVTISMTAVVESVDDPLDLLCSDVASGDVITATYTYDASTPDTNGADFVGDYAHFAAGAGIRVSLEDAVARTDPSDVNFLIELVNDHPSGGDNYLLRSYNNLPLPCGSPVSHIAWQLDDDSGNALSSTALTRMPPNLADFASIFGLTVEGSDEFQTGYFIRAHVTSVECREHC